MGDGFTKTFYAKRSRHKIGVTAGEAGGWRKCRFCGEKINAGDTAVCFHQFGEAPSFFHSSCALMASDSILDAARAAISGAP